MFLMPASCSRNYFHLMDEARNMLIKMLVFIVNLVQMKYYSSKRDGESQKCLSHEVENNLVPEIAAAAATPSPWLVPLPLYCMAESVKDQLPIMQYRQFVKKTGQDEESTRGEDNDSNDDKKCIVCLNGMEGREEVRELCNCCHAFHKDCLDAWIDEGQLTCPLCRTKLLPSPKSDSGTGEFGRLGDPWRAERMIYLFGEDYLMS